MPSESATLPPDRFLNRDAAAGMGKTDKYANWMSLLPDERYLSELNIPGTHDSGTANVEGSWNSSFNIVSCQKYFIQQQLYAGVRSLDIRTAWNNDSKDMVLVHGNDFTVCHTPNHGNNAKNKTFRSVLDTIIAYLAAHPTEAGKRSLVGISQIEACSCTSAQLHPVLQFVIVLRVQAKCGEQAKQDYCRKKPSLLRRPRHTSRLAIIQMYLSLSTALVMGPLTPSSALGR